jgi:hypothetical protein
MARRRTRLFSQRGYGMAGSQNTRRPAPQTGLEQWFKNTGDGIDQLRREAEARGRQIYEDAIRRGLPIVARTTQDIRELGAKALDVEQKTAKGGAALAKNVAAAVQHPHSPETQRFVRSVKDQTMAGVHGAGDAFTFGLADKGSAAVRAFVDSRGDLSQVRDLYHDKIEGEREQDRYETEHFGGARMAGQIAGSVAQVAALGPLGEAAQLARLGAALGKIAQVERISAAVGRAANVAMPGLRVAALGPSGRLASAARMIPSEYAAIGAAGAGTGVGSQAIGDVSRGRLSSAGDYLGAAGGGAIEALAATKLGVGGAGAVGGAATSVLQDAANGEDISLRNAAISGGVGGAVSGVTGHAVTQVANAEGIRSKQLIGEELSKLRSWMRLDPPKPGPHREHLSESFTVPDHRTDSGLVEAKFGPSASLSDRQNQARVERMLTNGYRVDHFLPEDIGKLIGMPIGQIIYNFMDRRAQDAEEGEVPVSYLSRRPR